MGLDVRRVVTGHDAEGKAIVVIDEGAKWTAGFFFHGGDDLESGGGIGDIGRMDGGVATSCDNGVADFVEFLHLAGDEGDGPSF